MIPLQIALSALCLLSALWLVVLIVRDRTPDNVVLNTLGVIELGLVAVLVLGLVRVFGDVPAGVSVWEYVSYLVGVLLFIPVGLVWSAGERTRGGTAVLLVAVLLVPFMFVRLADICGPAVAETRTRHGFGRVLVFVYGVFAVAATGRSSLQLATQASTAPLPYALSAFAAVVYLVATFALATGRRALALTAVGIELAGVLLVGLSSLVLPQEYPDATVWSDFGAGYAFIPLVLPLAGLWWLLRGSVPKSEPDH